MPPAATTPATAEYDKKLIASTVSASTARACSTTQHPHNDLAAAEAPIPRASLDHAARHVAQALLDQPAKYGIAANGQRHRRGPGRSSCSATTRVTGTARPRDDERERAHGVDEQPTIANSVPFAATGRAQQEQPDAQRPADQHRRGEPIRASARLAMRPTSSGRIAAMF